MELTTVWFILIAVLWTGYFVLEGFDFGVGILLPVLGRDDLERRVMINTIGPVWDGNEVWVLVAGGATFAAFPEWYATLFSGFYLPLFLILVSLIFRNVAFEYRGKGDSIAWKQWWDRAIFFGSLVPALLWGVAFGNIVRGVEIDADKEFVGSFFDLLNPYALLGGLVTLSLFVTHGAIFLSLKTVGEIRGRARSIATRTGLAAAVFAVAFLGWTAVQREGAQHLGWFVAMAVIAAVALLGALEANRREREGWAFVGTATTLGFAVAALFTSLFPNVMPSSLDDAWSLTTTTAASTHTTLVIMTWVAAIFTPIVLAYQTWTFVIFRRRIGVQHIPTSKGAVTESPKAPATSAADAAS